MITERLIKIKKRCEELLAIAAKRTPGKWNNLHSRVLCDGWFIAEFDRNNSNNNALFTSLCAGTAEAGWRATISVIDAYEMILRLQRDSDSMTEVFEHVEYSVDQILAAWSEELL